MSYEDYVSRLHYGCTNFTLARMPFGSGHVYTIYRDKYIGWYLDLPTLNEAIETLRHVMKGYRNPAFVVPSWMDKETEEKITAPFGEKQVRVIHYA